MTVLVVERHLVDPARAEQHRTAVTDLLQAMRRADGFLWAESAASSESFELVMILSEWRTPAQADAFSSGEADRRFRDVVDVCVREDVSVRRFFDGIQAARP